MEDLLITENIKRGIQQQQQISTKASVSFPLTWTDMVLDDAIRISVEEPKAKAQTVTTNVVAKKNCHVKL